jgi:hypothetical protein
MARLCSRPACAAPASATMSYDYRARSAWLDDLTPTAEPNGYDLCLPHAERLGVPVGWSCTDRRSTLMRSLVFERIAV